MLYYFYKKENAYENYEKVTKRGGATPLSSNSKDFGVQCHTEPNSGSHKEIRNRVRNDNKIAFTLAEVLITLGIIGVVAAMTIPTLVANYQKKVTATKVKKVFAELNQVVRLSEVENGPMNFWDFETPESIDTTRKFLVKYILPYYKNYQECGTGGDYTCGMPVSRNGVNYFMDSGVGLSFVPNFKNKKVYVTVSVNNIGSENIKGGRDWFYFSIGEGKVQPTGWYNGITRDVILGDGFIAHEFDKVDSEGQVVTQYNLACKTTARDEMEGGNIEDEYRTGCTALLMLDNWEFKDDYPW